MTSLLTINHYLEATNTFVYTVGSSNSAHYFYVAKPQPWTNTSGGADDSAFVSPNNSVSQVELDVYDDMLFGKLITSSDIGRVVPKYTWTSNTIYSQYDQNDANLYTKNFYVVTTDVNDEYNVYKCIDNNGNTASTIKPTLQNTSGTFKTADGYTWKYMYTIDVQSNTRFTTTGFMPVVTNSNVQSNAVAGTIDVIRVVTGGNGYNVYETGLVDSVIDRFTIKLPSTSSSLDGYYVNSSIYIKSGFGSGQVREIDTYSGTTKNITLVEPIDVYLRLDFANADLITPGGSVGETVRQVIDTITFTTRKGFINVGADLVQTDTGALAKTLSSNSSSVRVARTIGSTAFSNNFILRDLSSTGSLTTDKVNISNSTSLGLGIVLTSGTGYSGNATVTITSSTGGGATANAQSNSTGKIIAINIANTGNGYITEPTVVVGAPVAQTFNANTDVTDGTAEGANNVIALSTAPFFAVGDQVRYTVAAGNTVIGGLTNNSVYYIQFSNSTVIALSNTANTSTGNRIALTKGATETGHSFQGITATARILPSALYATNTAAAAVFASDYQVGDFIRVGENANSNIRVVQSVNSTVIVVDRLFASSITSANAFNVPTGILASSVTVTEANGVVSNTNLDNVKLEINNQSISGGTFIVGERVSANVANGVGTVVFSNATSLFLSGTSGTFSSGVQVRGSSSNLAADVVTVTSSPNVTLKNPQGTFTIGELAYFFTPAGAASGNGQLINVVDLSKFGVEYEIAPTVKITGDGTGAVAIAAVNTQVGMSNTISSITVLNPGSNYTEANVVIYANSIYGTGASVQPVISPINGHGYNPVSELGSRYACLDMKFDTLANENWYYPSSTSFRKFGIIKDPVFANVVFETENYTSFSLGLSNTVGTWSNGELITQATTNAAAFIVTSNSTLLRVRDTIGTFLPSYSIYGYTSDTTANVTTVQTTGFSFDQVIYQRTTNAYARVVSVVGTTLNLTDIHGKFSSNEQLACANSCAEAYISSNGILRSSDGLNLTNFFTQKFNQTARITLASNTGSFTQFEYITQDSTNATGRVISTTTDLDLDITTTNGAFTVGDSIVNSNTSANAKVTFANSTYLKLTGVSNTDLFFAGNEVTTTLGAIATIDIVYPALIVSDVSKLQSFTSGTSQIVGANSGSIATALSIINPDLIRESGKVVYSETSNNVITKDINTTERVRVVIKF